jgi:aminoglycoside phosphotransferase family enzyme/predicted kinase
VNFADPASALSSLPAQEAFVAAMQTPAPYAALHDVSEPIRCIETHVSWVFLTGPCAYKVKKPLRLPFLDYSTAARREWLCREELRLNRRHAPDLYVDTVPISGQPDAPRVGVDAVPVFEHALRMRQFDPNDELTHLLSRNAVTDGEIATLAEDLARMHAEATCAEASSPFGRPAALHRVTLDNFEEIVRWLPATCEFELLGALRAHVERIFGRLRLQMEVRRRDGHVREGHGDLHCGNVVRWHGRLVAFDGLEFDPALRFIDVANDLAFLSMDLGTHGRPDLRRTLLDRWTAVSGDYGAVELLPYYEVYRALVRAKVAALRGRQHQGSAESIALSHSYLVWAERRTARRPPTLIAMAGLSGSGKTWLARRIAASIDALHLRSDVERKRLAGLAPLASSHSGPDGGIYTREFNDRTYARLLECAGACLRGDENVVVDAANLRRNERNAFVRLAAGLGARVQLVHCVAPIEVLRERIAARHAKGQDASEATVALLDRQPAFWEPFDAAEMKIGCVVDTTHGDQIDAAAQCLARAAGRDDD